MKEQSSRCWRRCEEQRCFYQQNKRHQPRPEESEIGWLAESEIFLFWSIAYLRYLTCLLCQTKQNNNNKNKRYRKTNSQIETDRQTGKQTDRQTHSADRQTRRQKHAGEREGLSLEGAATCIILVATNTLSRQKRLFLFFWSLQKYAYRDKTFVTTNICRDKHNCVAKKVLSRQAYFCRDKTSFATKMILVATPASERGLGTKMKAT